jgi:hypothetical protein
MECPAVLVYRFILRDLAAQFERCLSSLPTLRYASAVVQERLTRAQFTEDRAAVTSISLSALFATGGFPAPQLQEADLEGGGRRC